MLEAVITVCCFMVVHLCGTVWWMSRIQTTLEMLTKTLADNQSASQREQTRMESRVDAAWKAIDEINGRCMERAKSVTQVEVNTKRIEEIEHRMNK